MYICQSIEKEKSTVGRYRITHVSVMLLVSTSLCFALTRWSAVQLVPNADLIEGGSFVLNAQGYFFSDIIDGPKVQPQGMVNFGIIEWVNIEAGYTGGFNLGIKARILGETKPWMPSLAVGVHNIFSHREAWLYNRMGDSLSNELYLVLGKSVEAARLRFHVGIQSIPGDHSEQFNPCVVIEKYFGMNLYVTGEVHRRDRKVHPSLFVSWRFWKRRLEISAGAVDIAGMFFSDEVQPNSPFFKSSDATFVRPGIWFGLRFKGNLKIGRNDGLNGLETSLTSHSNSISELRGEIDSLKQLLRSSSSRIENMDRSLADLTDSSLTDGERLKALAVDRLAVLKTLYESEPFEPEAVSKVMAELVANRDRMLPALYEIIFNPVQENTIRTLAITALGEIGTQAAADIVIEVLGKSPNAEMTIECLIALGKMKETRAVYLMQQLSNDPNDDIAFTAAEVLQKLEKETGVSITPVPAAMLQPESIPENRIGSGKAYKQEPPVKKSAPVKKTKQPEWKPVAPAATADTALQKVEPVEFMEATVAEDTSGVSSGSGKAVPVSEKKIPEPNMPEPIPATAAEKLPVDDVNKAEVTAPANEMPSASPPETVKAQAEKPAEKTGSEKPKQEEPQSTKKTEKKKDKPRRERPKIDLSKETW